ncbi:MAG: phosphatase PAP2 family protein [Erysipelotrichaceae bacterium]|nr:phosphatase PAP2 family protein [Erysipelotrichaceae bacterium]
MSEKIVPKQWMIWMFAGALAVFGIGTFFDLQINQILYRPESVWALFLYGFGAAPIFWCLLSSGILLIFKIRTANMWKNAGLTAVGILLTISGLIFPAYYAYEHITISLYLTVVSTFLVDVLPTAGILFLVWHTDQKKLRLMIAFMLILSIGSYATVSLIKGLFQRPRFIALLREPGLFFQPWWMITEKNLMISKNVLTEPDLFRSFPSGHTTSAAAIFAFVSLPLFSPAVEKQRNLLFVLAVGYVVLIAVSRIVLGYHFLTDVTAGFLISMAFFVFDYNWMVKKYKELS